MVIYIQRIYTTQKHHKSITSDVYMNRTIKCSTTQKPFELAGYHNLELQGACLVPLASLCSCEGSCTIPIASIILHNLNHACLQCEEYPIEKDGVVVLIFNVHILDELVHVSGCRSIRQRLKRSKETKVKVVHIRRIRRLVHQAYIEACSGYCCSKNCIIYWYMRRSIVLLYPYCVMPCFSRSTSLYCWYEFANHISSHYLSINLHGLCDRCAP